MNEHLPYLAYDNVCVTGKHADPGVIRRTDRHDQAANIGDRCMNGRQERNFPVMHNGLVIQAIPVTQSLATLLDRFVVECGLE